MDYECDEVCKAYHIGTVAELDYTHLEVCLQNELPDPTTNENSDSEFSEKINCKKSAKSVEKEL